jgi:chemotaxis protein methyltransferase CheR
MSDSPTISDHEFEAFREYFGRKIGIYFEPSKRYFVDRRLEQRMRETGHRTCGQYLRFVQLQTSQVELQALVNAMTVNETYFFREEYQLEALVGHVMDDLLARKRAGEPLRIWSLPCSTGEEPYSIAMYLLEHWGPMSRIDVEIVGSDINSAVLDSCRRGVYTAYSMRNLPPELQRKYFQRLDNGNFQISADLRDAISFTNVNIIDPATLRGYRDFDLVFCRNLLIYFDEATRRDAVQSLYDALAPGGFICLGHSESMSRISSLFTVAKMSNSLIYQKPLQKPRT